MPKIPDHLGRSIPAFYAGAYLAAQAGAAYYKGAHSAHVEAGRPESQAAFMRGIALGVKKLFP